MVAERIHGDCQPTSAPITPDGVSQLHRFILTGPSGVEFTPVHNAADVDGFARRLPNRFQRDAIVAAATSDGPAVADRLWLTPFGAWADIAREWADIDWIQRVQGGRDQFVQVVERGTLLPFGHQAVVTSTVTRQWVVDADGDVVAATITQEHFAIAGAPAVEFPGTGAPNDGRDLPFRSIRVEDRESVPVDRQKLVWTGPAGGERSIATNAAWKVVLGPGVQFSGQDVRLTYAGTDRAGNESVRFSLSAVFVPNANVTPQLLADIADFYESDEGLNSRRALTSTEMAWADPIIEGGRASTLLTSEIDFSFRPGVGGAPVAPHVTRGSIRKPELIPPGAPATQTAIEVVFSPEFLASGNDPDANPNKAFLDLVVSVDLPIGAEARAVMTPELTAEEFNQTIGVGPKLDKPAPDVPLEWNPQQAFGVAAELLRGINLADLVLPVLFDLALPGIDIPSFSVVELPESITQTYEWCPNEIQSVDDGRVHRRRRHVIVHPPHHRDRPRSERRCVGHDRVRGPQLHPGDTAAPGESDRVRRELAQGHRPVRRPGRPHVRRRDMATRWAARLDRAADRIARASRVRVRHRRDRNEHRHRPQRCAAQLQPRRARDQELRARDFPASSRSSTTRSRGSSSRSDRATIPSPSRSCSSEVGSSANWRSTPPRSSRSTSAPR